MLLLIIPILVQIMPKNLILDPLFDGYSDRYPVLTRYSPSASAIYERMNT